jgi:L-ascorbate metabolism protein UlaG (beta-lactamase superfamily)
MVLALTLCGCFSGPRYAGPVTEHFDGERFVNPTGRGRPGTGDLFRLALSRAPGPWNPDTRNRIYPAPPARVGPGALRVTFVNHATTLIQMDGLNLLTDPIYAERCSPVSFAGPKRIRPPGVAMADLPPLDAVIVSHNHYDHMDLETLRALAQRNPGLRIFVGLGNGALLSEAGIPGAEEVEWRQRIPLSEAVTLVGWPSQHFSGRGLTDGDATLWLSYVLLGPGGPVYFAGDTGMGPHFADAGAAFGPFRLAVLPIGAYLPTWFMGPIHISPEEAVQAALALRARTSVGMHFGTFPLADDGQYTPVRALKAALEASHPRPRFWVLGFGQGRDVPR